MRTINPTELIEHIPDLLNLFLSGFLFMAIYDWLNVKKHDFSEIVIDSLFISYFIRILMTFAHSFILRRVSINASVKVLICALVGIVTPFVLYAIKNTSGSKWLFERFFHKTDDNILNRIIDFNSAPVVQVHLKTTSKSYRGIYKFHEENGEHSRIVLHSYTCLDDDYNELKSLGEDRSIIAIDLSDIDTLEIVYGDDSKVYESITKQK